MDTNHRPFPRLLVLALAMVVLTAGLTGCATGPRVHTHADPATSLAQYRTYAFVAEPGTNRAGYSTFITQYFKEAIRREMDARGYVFDENNPDLLINFHANAREVTEVRSTPGYAGPGFVPYGYYYGYRAGLYMWEPWYGRDVETIRYRVGTANVDVVDARRKQMVWEAVAEGRLSTKAMREPQGAIEQAVREMFLQYPARAGGDRP